MPSPGKITTFHPPGGPGIRLDTACYAEAVVPPYYDSMIAKVIARGNTRGEAILRMRRALESFVVEGIKTNLPLQQRILQRGGLRPGPDLDRVHGALPRPPRRPDGRLTAPPVRIPATSTVRDSRPDDTKIVTRAARLTIIFTEPTFATICESGIA